MLHFFDPTCEELRQLTREEPSAFAPPPAFGPFRVLHQVGVGALGPVFRTYEPTRDRLIAVKVFRLDVTPEQAQALADELSRSAEASLFHPSIIEPIAAGVEGTVAYRAEEYVAAETLDVAMRHYAPAPLDKVLPFITQLAGAIDFARAAGVGHGGLHPRDVFVTPDEARAGGFGVVDALERVGLRAPMRRPYTAPERIAGVTWGTPADVFSLAAITFELLTGRRAAGTGRHIGVLSGSDLATNESAVHDVLARAMDDDPANRYTSALEFAAALETAARTAHPTVPLAVAEVAPPLTRTADIAPPSTPPADLAPRSTAHAPAPRASQVEEEEAFDDVEVEREEDEAHFAAFEAERREREAAEAEPEADLFPEESEPDRFVHVQDNDLPLTAAPPPKGAEPAPPRLQYQPAPSPRPERAAAPAVLRGDFLRAPDPSEPEVREGTRMLPLAVTLMVGLLLGFMAGYMVGGRDRPVPSSTTASAPTEATAPPATGQQPSGGREFSEQVVAPSSGARGTPGKQPPNATPPVPGDRARESETAPVRPAAPVRGKLVVQSSPSRANVTVNGQWRGRTPLALENLPLGPYNVRVVQPGFDVAREQITLSASQAARTVSFKLQPTRGARADAPDEPLTSSNTGVLFVDSRPRGAQVFVDGRLIGTTPLRVPDVAIGSHVVRLELKGHSRWTTSTTISSGREARVTGSLDPIQ